MLMQTGSSIIDHANLDREIEITNLQKFRDAWEKNNECNYILAWITYAMFCISS